MPLADYNVFLKQFLLEKGYQTNKEREDIGLLPNSTGTYDRLRTEASDAYREITGTKKKAAPRTHRTTLRSDLAPKFKSYCQPFTEPQCKAHKEECKWMGGTLQRCQRNSGAGAVKRSQALEKAAIQAQRAFRGRRGQAGGRGNLGVVQILDYDFDAGANDEPLNIFDVDLSRLIDDIESAINTPRGQQFIRARKFWDLFELGKQYIQEPGGIPGDGMQIWPKEIYAVYFATQLHFQKVPPNLAGLSILENNDTVGQPITNLYHDIMNNNRYDVEYLHSLF